MLETRPYIPKVRMTSPMMKLKMTLVMPKSRKFAGRSRTKMCANPLSRNSVPTVMFSVDAVLPPTKAPAMRASPTTSEMALREVFDVMPAIRSPLVLNGLSVSAKPRAAKRSRIRPHTADPQR